jgi:hypothetical protein
MILSENRCALFRVALWFRRAPAKAGDAAATGVDAFESGSSCSIDRDGATNC